MRKAADTTPLAAKKAPLTDAALNTTCGKLKLIAMIAMTRNNRAKEDITQRL